MKIKITYKLNRTVPETLIWDYDAETVSAFFCGSFLSDIYLEWNKSQFLLAEDTSLLYAARLLLIFCKKLREEAIVKWSDIEYENTVKFTIKDGAVFIHLFGIVLGPLNLDDLELAFSAFKKTVRSELCDEFNGLKQFEPLWEWYES